MRYQKWLLAGVLLVGLWASTTSAALVPTFSTIDFPGATETNAYGINARGQIVGLFFDGLGSHGFILEKGTFTAIDVPGVTVSGALGINARGRSSPGVR